MLFRCEAWAVGDRRGIGLSLLVHGEAVAQPRHRVRRIGTNMVFYDPSTPSKRKYKRAVHRSLLAIGVSQRPVFPANGRLVVDVTFHVTNPNKDVDNMLKYTLDSLQDVMYGNDRNIYEVHCKKVNDTSEFTEIMVSNMS